jgi:hypothetical protein
MGHVVPDRLRLQGTMLVALALLMTQKSQVFAFSQNPFLMLMKRWLSTMATKTYRFIAVAGVPRITGRRWVLLHILSRRLFSMGSTMVVVGRDQSLYLQVATALGTGISATLMVIRTAYTLSLSLPSISRANIRIIRKPAQPI